MTLDEVIRTANGLYQSKTPEAVFSGYQRFAKSVGYPHVFIGRLGFLMSSPAGPPRFFMTNMDDWADVYIKQGYIHVDPCVHLAMRINRAFFYKEALHDLTPAQENFLEQAKAHGLADGLVIPVHRRVGAAGAVSLGAPNPVKITHSQQLQLELMGHVAFAVIDRLIGEDVGQDPMRLTDRERTVLTLVARGKTNWEIGAILSISEYSVRDYLKSLAKRLETSNRTHTVARAIQLGLISP